MKGTGLLFLNDGPQKPVSIHQHVGQRPILAAGNADGDLPMMQWTAASPHRSLQLAVHHTDSSAGTPTILIPLLVHGTAQLLAAASDNRWEVVDMARDWSAIFPTG